MRKKLIKLAFWLALPALAVVGMVLGAFEGLAEVLSIYKED